MAPLTTKRIPSGKPSAVGRTALTCVKSGLLTCFRAYSTLPHSVKQNFFGPHLI